MRITLATILLTLLVPVALACAGPAPISPAETQTPVPGRVVVNGFAFSPVQVSVAAGESVTWVNQDAVIHSITGDGWDSGDLATGSSFSRIFDQAGTFDYFCKYHPVMRASVVVR